MVRRSIVCSKILFARAILRATSWPQGVSLQLRVAAQNVDCAEFIVVRD